MTTPYTYRIKFLPTGEYYYGVRYAKNCHPSDLWIRYFTSSTKVKDLIRQYGKESFSYEIRKIFSCKESAISWEERVTKRVIYWPNYFNSNSGKAFNHNKSSNGGISAAKKKVGIHSMSSEEKSAAGRKGGKSLGRRKREAGLTEKEKEGLERGHRKISQRRNSGEWTEKEMNARLYRVERRKNGDWTEKEREGYKKLNERRLTGRWTEKELSGFEKLSNHRKTGYWISNGLTNKFVLTKEEIPEGWLPGFTRKGKFTPSLEG